MDRDPGKAERELTHLLLQWQLRDWLAHQGLTGEIEKRLAGGGRADIHVEVEARRQTIEVQLSPLSHERWLRRTELYASQVHQVHWLFGPEVGGSLAEEEAEARGWSLLLRWFHAAAPAMGLAVEIGTLTRSWIRWSPLSDCLLTPDGIETPHLEAAVTDHTRHQAEQERRRRAEQEAALARIRRAEETARHRQAAKERAARRVRERSEQLPLVSLPRPVTAVPPRSSAQTLTGFLKWTPSFPEWQETQDWSWMGDIPSAQVTTALKAATYILTHGTVNGPISCLTFPDVPDGGLIERLLCEAGLIRVFDHRGVRRWERV